MHTGRKHSGNKKIPSQSKVCYASGNPGHFAKQCNKRIDENAVSSYSECFVSPLQESNYPEITSNLIVDTGCSDHFLTQKDMFINLRTVNEKGVRDPKGNLAAIEEIGDVPITVK